MDTEKDASQTVENDELLRAASGEPTEEKKEEESANKEIGIEVKDEPKKDNSDNAEKSHLGRKVKRLESVIEELNNKLDSLNRTTGKSSQIEEELEEDDYTPITKKELGNYLKSFQEKEAIRKEKEQKEYSNKYIRTVYELSKEDDSEEDGIAESILEEMDKNYNKRYSNDPVSDAKENYLKAFRAVTKGKKTGTPLDKNIDKKSAPLGVGGDIKIKTNTGKKIELDREALEYAKKVGLSEEDIESAFR